ncbi:MAG: DUF4149 domain-containing protein [Terracidiphilus sp.]
MKTLFRALLYFSLITWLGAEIFFPVVAAVTFETLRPDTHTAGMIVGSLLRILHGMGLVSAMVALGLLALGGAWNIYKPRTVLVPMALLVLAVGFTIYSQFSIIPAMERDRINAGGAIDAAAAADLSRMDFEKLHRRSVNVEGAILLLGLATVVFVARAENVRV